MNPETFLYRQAHPNFMKDGDITSQVFFPFPKDDARLSVDDGAQTTAEESFQHFTEVEGLLSEGVWAVQKHEAEDLHLAVEADPKTDWPPHSVIDFRNHEEKSWRKLAKKLRAYATEHGCFHRPG